MRQPRPRRAGPTFVFARICLALVLVAGPAWAQITPATPATGAPGAPAPTVTPPPPPPRVTSPAAGQKVIIERVVAVVNDSVLLASDLSTRLMVMTPDLDAIPDPDERARRMQKLAQQALTELVNDELMVQAAEAAGIEVTAAEVDAGLEEIRVANKFDQAALEAALAEQGFTIASFKADLLKQLLRLRAVNQLVATKVNITEDQIRARYDQLTRRTESVKAVRLAQILFRVPEPATEQGLAAARAEAAEVQARIARGEDFAALATALSDDDATRAGGGELGWFQRGSLAPEWEQVVFAMDVGDVRGPIAGPQGMHVFKVIEIERNPVKSYEELRETLRAELRRREVDRQTATWLEGLRRDAYIDVKVGS